MKLATLKDGSRDGRLVVVSKDLRMYCEVDHIARSMRAALDDWSAVEDELQTEYERLNEGQIAGQRFDPQAAMAPLPRASLWADGSAYVNHVELVRKARGAELPDSFWTDPLMYLGAPDAILGPHDDIQATSEDWGIDMEAEVAVIVDDCPQGITAEDAAAKIKLVMILNDVSFRALIPGELAKGFGFVQSKGPTSFAPVAVSLDELGELWQNGTLHRPMNVDYNDNPFGKADINIDMTFNFPQLVAHAAKTRDVQAGAIIGSGTISNKDDDGSPGKPVKNGGKGYSCIAEIRMIETIANGQPTTPFMRFDDKVKIEVTDENGASIFGAIEQRIVKYEA